MYEYTHEETHAFTLKCEECISVNDRHVAERPDFRYATVVVHVDRKSCQEEICRRRLFILCIYTEYLVDS